jgi:hypothetical protein
MQPALKLNVFVGFPSYGGNGGIASEHPDVREWWTETVLKMKADPRVGEIHAKTVSDTPITMVRNRFVRMAREHGCHLLMMVDSDQSPNKHVGEPWYKPFWDVAFDAVYRHYGKGPLVVGAPYCGPPGAGENVYVFNFSNRGDYGDESAIGLDQYTRHQASMLAGVQECAALPTGLILYDMRAFELIEPSGLSHREVLEKVREGTLQIEEAERQISQGWFYYEWKDGQAAQKASTEDVTNTRDIALAGVAKLGYNPLRCAWDSWIGHHKPFNVGKPQPYTVENVAKSLINAVKAERHADEALVALDLPLQPGWRVASPVNTGRRYQGTHQSLAQRTESLADAIGIESAKEWMNKFVAASAEDQDEMASEYHDLITKRKEAAEWLTFHKTPPEDLEALKHLVRLVVERFDWASVVDVGSWLGDSAIAMMEAGAYAVCCVDTWEPTPDDPLASLKFDRDEVIAEHHRRLLDASLRHGVGWRTIYEPSVAAAEDECVCRRQLVFIDACHAYEAVKADILAWGKNVVPGGILCGHDYGTTQFPGVKKAVDEIFGKENVKVGGRCVWWVNKPYDAPDNWPNK